MGYIEDINAVAELSLPWEKLEGCNVLVTGATGLIGSAIVEVLLSRSSHTYQVYACGRDEKRADNLFLDFKTLPTYHFLKHDITKPIECDVAFHYIIHCASGAAPADFSQHPVEVVKANILGVDNLLEHGRLKGLKRLLYVSSGEVYGEGDGRVFTEDYSGFVNPVLPRSCYPSSKRAAETLCVSYSAEYGLDVVIARPCHIFGPHFTTSDNRVYAQFIRNVLNNEDIVLKSEGLQYRSWCYVVDCVSAILHILLMGKCGHAYNIADENSNLTIKELAGIVSDLGGRKVVMEHPSLLEGGGGGTITRAVFSSKKIRELGWKPKSTIKEGMLKTINYLLNKTYDES